LLAAFVGGFYFLLPNVLRVFNTVVDISVEKAENFHATISKAIASAFCTELGAGFFINLHKGFNPPNAVSTS
jgi:hypothetical protein